MKIKLNRGPLKNKYYEVENYTNDFIVQEPLKFDWSKSFDPMMTVGSRRGTYHRSNVTQKNGAVVFEWMGWRE